MCLIVVKQNIDINNPGAVSLFPYSSDPGFYFQDFSQELPGQQLSFYFHDLVKKRGLVGFAPCRSFIYRRKGNDIAAVLFDQHESFLQGLFPVAHVTACQ